MRGSPPSGSSSACGEGRTVARSTTRPSLLLTALWVTTTTSPSSSGGAGCEHQRRQVGAGRDLAGVGEREHLDAARSRARPAGGERRGRERAARAARRVMTAPVTRARMPSRSTRPAAGASSSSITSVAASDR